uniref:Transmembrane protein n=1 Tax=Heterorhabditis bacteriophora TaxID=37862 RepID=A0A1I7WJ80_HETBA
MAMVMEVNTVLRRKRMTIAFRILMIAVSSRAITVDSPFLRIFFKIVVIQIVDLIWTGTWEYEIFIIILIIIFSVLITYYRSSTPDQSLESMTITSKSETSSESTSRSNTEISWNDLFEQLKREMYQMRERDAQILADLHKVESQIQSVKLSQMERSYNDTYRDKLGKLVPSLPI